MINIKKQAELIKNQRLSLIKLSNEINALVFNYQLNYNDDSKMIIDYSVSTLIELRIIDPKTFECIERKEIWLIEQVFESHLSMHSTIQEINKNVKIAKANLKEMKTMAEKYIKLNNSKHAV